MIAISRIIIPFCTFIIHAYCQSNNRTMRVAFVFAGSARSFVMPAVKTVIKPNLLDSFCPQDSCAYDVFVRISSNDNNHVGDNAKGILTKATAEKKKQIADSLIYLKPSDESVGQLHIEYYEIGSKEEMDAMIEYGKNDFRHRIYRELDTRRYSMYFGRHMAYEMMLNYEKSKGVSFDWVVHARLDTFWGEPIKPARLWEMGDKMYAPDTWFADIPDTFALLPRKIADIYFSLDILLEPKTLCLGGPNFNTKTIEKEVLLKNNYNITEIEMIQNENCLVMYPEHNIVKDKHGDWSFAGFSEFFLKRKMKSKGYELSNGKVVLIPLFMHIVRYPLNPVCFYLEADYLISFAKVNTIPSAALVGSCHLANNDFKTFEDDKASVCGFSPIPNTDSPPSEELKIAERQSCLLKPENSDLNFMPFRIRRQRQCITTSDKFRFINTTNCVNNIRFKFMEQYLETQLFHMYPLIQTPQKIRQYIKRPNHVKRCLTVVHLSDFKYRFSGNHTNIYNLEMANCDLEPNLQLVSKQMFTINLVDKSKINKRKANQNSHSSILKPITAAYIIWVEPVTFDRYCINSYDNINTDYQPNKKNPIILTKCHNDKINLVTQPILLERTTATGPPHAQGITIGKMPTWADP